MTTLVPSPNPTPPSTRGMLLQDSLPRELFDRVARLGAAALGAPVAVVVLSEDGRTLLRGGSGLPDELAIGREVPPGYALPARARGAAEPLVITATRAPAPGALAAGSTFVAMPFAVADGLVAGAIYLFAGDGTSAAGGPGGAESAVLADLAALLAGDIALRRDLDEHTQVQRQLRHNTLHDALTQLPNRTLFMERMGHAIARAKRHPDYRFAVLFLDLDRFKVVNDSLGHQAGDQLLVTVARRLEACLREDDTVARLGGDEFAVLADVLRSPSGEVLAERLRAAVALVGADVGVTASVGVAEVEAGDDVGDLMHRADAAMYQSKTAGGDRITALR